MRRRLLRGLSVVLLTMAAGAASSAMRSTTPGLLAGGSEDSPHWPILPAPQATDKVPAQVSPFDLADVRLLDGPFRDAMLRDQRFLLDRDPDRLLHTFRLNAGLPSSAAPLGGWEAPDVELRGHSLGHYLSALALMWRSTGDARFKAKADTLVGELGTIQAALATRFHPGYLSAFPEQFFDRVEARKPVWAPYYTLHKIMAGLLDVHLLCGNAQALDIVARMADWVRFRQERLAPEQQQRMLQTEFGGMGEVLANLYGVTGNPDHLRLARTFDHAALFDPLARGVDPLDGLHGNTQIPKMIAAAREYELTGEKRYYDIATFFWQRVAHLRSYVIGGNTDDEGFFPIDQFARHLGPVTTETCNTYNMLKLTRHLFALSPSAEYMDFYERALFNHILASQDPATGMVCYYVPLKPAAFKTYSTPDDSFWCCVGTGMENHAKYGDTIYFHDRQSLYLNLFVASELRWREKGLTVRQETRFPASDTTTLRFTAAAPVRLSLKVRCPGWAQSGMTLTVNGKTEVRQARPGSYASVDREWKTGDVVHARLPMTIRTETLPGDPTIVALLDGPIVLAGDLGTEGLDQVKRYGPSAPQVERIRTPEIPALVGDVKAIPAAVRPVAGAPLTFRTSGIARPRDVTLLPFYKASGIRYTVYWKVYAPGEWDARKHETAAAESRRQSVERRTVDEVVANTPQSEQEHAYTSEGALESYIEGRKARSAKGWFSYALKTSDGPLKLVCTYRGASGDRPTFDILVDGETLASESMGYHPTETFDVEYAVPEALTKGKARITVTFRARPNSMTAAVLEVRTVRAR